LKSSARLTEEDTTRIGVGQRAMMYSVAARPVITGIIMSMVTISGRLHWQISMARLPYSASPMISSSGSAARISSRRLRTVRESSATRTRIFDIV
jgi:hypothetical protein